MAKFSLQEDEEEETIITKRRKTDHEEEEEEEEEKLGECSNGSSSSGGIKARIDPDSLDCSICFNPLRPPLYQCLNGHVACSPCWTKLHHKCHICTVEVSMRNIALEKVLESIQIPCSFIKSGCLKSFTYSEREEHEQNCRFRPSPCPVRNCTHKGISGDWLEHFERDHNFARINFHFNESFKVKINQLDPYLILIGPDNNILLLINKPVGKTGHGISLFYADFSQIQDCYILSYEINVLKNTSKLQLKSEIGCVKELKGDELGGIFLFVPLGFCGSGIIDAEILIRKL
ncbi:hypothetical protein LUZ60_002939 [Juncus effusus]|nr:hypothetical protein LUZ60_002939 [Juncus effusus]